MSEPSMEEILSSIKRIIAEDGDDAGEGAPRARRPARSKAAAAAEQPADVLELTADYIDEEEAIVLDTEEDVATHMSATDEPEQAVRTAPAAQVEAAPSAPVVSDDAVRAARESLSHLSALLIRPADAPSNTLEGLVQEMLRPMLKEWLDANLPDIVDRKVAQEIARISGRVA